MKSKALSFLTSITMFLIFPMLLIALVLYLSGFRGPVQLDNTYYNFLQQAAIRADSWGVQIPYIPLISGDGEVYELFTAVIAFCNLIIRFFNAIIGAINMIITLFTTMAALISLIFEYWQNGDLSNSSSGGLSYWNQMACVLTL